MIILRSRRYVLSRRMLGLRLLARVVRGYGVLLRRRKDVIARICRLRRLRRLDFWPRRITRSLVPMSIRDVGRRRASVRLRFRLILLLVG